MNATTNNLYYIMKTTNLVRIAFRILVQSCLPMLVMELLIVLLFGILDPKPRFKDYISYASTDYHMIAAAILGGCIALFGIWFHFISEHRFKNRRPKGLYKEYILWFMEQEK